MRIWSWISVMAMVTVIAQRSGGEPPPQERHVVRLKALTKLATDKRFETVWGDPSIAGAPFVVRIHAEPSYIIMPHTHEVDENIVVVKGSWALGMEIASSEMLSNPWRSAILDSHPGKWCILHFPEPRPSFKFMESGPSQRNGWRPCTNSPRRAFY